MTKLHNVETQMVSGSNTTCWLNPKSWTGISTADGRVLVAYDILRTEKRTDAATVSKKIAGIKQKLRYYIIDTTALKRGAWRRIVRLKIQGTAQPALYYMTDERI